MSINKLFVTALAFSTLMLSSCNDEYCYPSLQEAKRRNDKKAEDVKPVFKILNNKNFPRLAGYALGIAFSSYNSGNNYQKPIDFDDTDDKLYKTVRYNATMNKFFNNGNHIKYHNVTQEMLKDAYVDSVASEFVQNREVHRMEYEKRKEEELKHAAITVAVVAAAAAAAVL